MAVLVAFTAFAQENASDYKKVQNQGNEAYNNKDYASAISYYEQYFKIVDEQQIDDEMYLMTRNYYEMCFYYAGNAAVRAKDYPKAYDYYAKFEKLGREDTPTDGKFLYAYANVCKQVDQDAQAEKLYRRCIELNYNAAACYFALAQMYRAGGNLDEMNACLSYALDSIPQEKNNYYAKMVLLYQIEQMKEATVPFNEASTWSKKASEAGNDINGYLTNMSKACDLYRKAIPQFEDVMKYQGVDDKTKANYDRAAQSVNICKESISRFEDYRKSIKK